MFLDISTILDIFQRFRVAYKRAHMQLSQRTFNYILEGERERERERDLVYIRQKSDDLKRYCISKKKYEGGYNAAKGLISRDIGNIIFYLKERSNFSRKGAPFLWGSWVNFSREGLIF